MNKLLEHIDQIFADAEANEAGQPDWAAEPEQ
jgi:hypothetical protein